MDRLLDDIIQDPHHSHGLFLAEAFGLEALDELQGIKVVVSGASRGRMKSATSWVEACDIYAIVSDRIRVLSIRLGGRGLSGNEGAGDECSGGGRSDV